MKITREADYALRIIAMLADENRQIEAKAKIGRASCRERV